jgi:acyl dehydratase
MNSKKWPASKFIAEAGNLERSSDWIVVDQQRIDQFADTTQDHQFIHVDEARAKAETMWEGTIAHGFLSLSLLSSMIQNCFPSMDETAMSINYGFDRIRFLNPVRSGARIRGHFKLLECTPRKPGELMNRYQVTVEIENIEKPALVAEWLGLAIQKED